MYRLAKFAPGGGAMGAIESPPARGHLAIWGILDGCADLVKYAMQHDRSFYFVDRAYFRRGRLATGDARYRVTHNRLQAGQIVKRSADRWSELNITLTPRRKGKSIIVCPPTSHSVNFFGKEAEDWLAQTLSELDKYTKRPIVVRNKPLPGRNGVPFETAIRDAWAVVTFNSNVAVEALIHGVPVFTSKYSAAAPVANMSLASIEKPWFPDRRPWCYHLAYCQFKYHEILNGTIWKYL